MNEKFATFIAPARALRSRWAVFAALVFLIVAYVVLSIAVVAVIAGVTALLHGIPVGVAFSQTTRALLNDGSPQGMILILSTFSAMFAAPWLTTRLFRKQPFRSLIGRFLGKGGALRNFAITLAILAPVLFVTFALSLWSGDTTQNQPFARWIVWLLPALPLILLQVSAEELVFRGYLMQELAVRFSSRWIWMAVPAIIFGALHLDFETYGSNAVLIFVATTLFGFVAADLTIRTGNLGAAIGVHFANNFMALALLSPQGVMNGLSLFVTRTHISDVQATRGLLLADIATLIALYTAYLLVLRWLAKRN